MKEQGYQYTTDLLVIGCGFSGMWAAMRARDFLGDVLVVDKGPRDWGGLGGLSGGVMRSWTICSTISCIITTASPTRSFSGRF